jgi:hypothetical protein
MTGNLPGQHFVAELAGASSNNSPTVISLFPLSFKWEKAGGGSVFFPPNLLARRAEGKKERKRKRKRERERERERVPNTIFLILLGCSGASSYWYNWKIKVFMAGAWDLSLVGKAENYKT